MASSNFSVTWDQYNSSICAGLQQLQQQGEFVDMTLAADGHLVRVHQLVIGLASPYLKDIIRSLNTPHPVIFLNDISHSILCQILEYVYTGEAIIPVNTFKQFVAAGKALHIKGISDMMLDLPTVTETPAQPAETAPSTAMYEMVYRDAGNSTTLQGKRPHASIDITLPPKKVKISDLIPIEPADSKTTHNEVSPDDEHIDNYDSNDDSADFVLSTLDKKGETDQLKPKLMFSRSNKGGLQVILNRFLYYLAHTYKDGRKRWECVDNRVSKCKAYVVTNGSEIVNRFNTHIHPRHDKKIVKKVKSGSVYATIENVDDSNALE